MKQIVKRAFVRTLPVIVAGTLCQMLLLQVVF